MVSPYCTYTVNLNIIVNHMSDLNLKANWNELKGKLKQEYGELTEDDVVYVEGKEDELMGRLQKRLGKSKEELASQLKEWIDSIEK